MAAFYAFIYARFYIRKFTQRRAKISKVKPNDVIESETVARSDQFDFS